MRAKPQAPIQKKTVRKPRSEKPALGSIETQPVKPRIPTDASSLTPLDVLQFQQTVGNQAVQRLLAQPPKPIETSIQLARSPIIQRFVDPAVTTPLGAAPLRPQIYTVYSAHVQSEYRRVLETLERRSDLRGQYGVLHNAWETFIEDTTTTDGHSNSPLKHGAARALAALNALVQAVNTADNLVASTPLAIEEAGQAKVGTEFTFTTPALHGLKTGKDNSVMELAVSLIKKWKLTSGSGPEEIKPTRRTKSPAARMFVYEIKGSPTSWWWVLDIDDGCLETQTAPISIEDLNASKHIQYIISKDIFGGAADLELAPHAEVGGGHLSLDRETTFGESALAFRNFIVTYANLADQWRRLDIDFINAPLIQELPVAQRREFVQVIHDFDTAYTGPLHQKWTLDRLATELTNRVFTFVRTVEQMGHAPHYQATNLEHLQDKDRGSQRIEMRRFPAQQDLKDLLFSHLAMLVELITASRQTTPVQLEQIDTNTQINADKIANDAPVDVEAIKSAQIKLSQEKRPTIKENRELQKASLLDKP